MATRINVNAAEDRAALPWARFGRMLATVLFTLVEAWALVIILAHVRAGGMDRIALAVGLAGGVVAVIDAWQNLRTRRQREP